MLLKITQSVTAFLACVLCVFIIGPMAAVIQVTRWIRGRITGRPMHPRDRDSILPLSITALITFTIVAVIITVV